MSKLQLKVFPTVSAWNTIRGHIDQLSVEHQWNEQQLFDISLICEEWFMNIVHHSQSDPNLLVDVEVEEQADGVIRIYFADNGVPFTPFSKPVPSEIKANVNQAVGGLGLYIIQIKIDRHQYRYYDNQNQLEMYYIKQ